MTDTPTGPSALADLNLTSKNYYLVAKALSHLKETFTEQPSLEEVSTQCNLSPYHFQRIFKRWVGISPKRFLQYLTVEYAKQRLAESRSILDASFESGLSGPGRLHDLLVSCEAVTPGQLKAEGRDLSIWYGTHPTPFGECLIAATERGICSLEFQNPGAEPAAELKSKWREARIEKRPDKTEPLVRRIFSEVKHDERGRLRLLLKGTNYQIQVWQALLRIPPGCVISYQDLAAYAGNRRASRAAANAVASNPIAYLIPCHRVIRKMGIIGGYRWGTERKRAMLGWEFSRGSEQWSETHT